MLGFMNADDTARESADVNDGAAKHQRRADLVTLTAAALAGMLGNPAYENWSLELSASNAVLVAETAVALIEERTK